MVPEVYEVAYESGPDLNALVQYPARRVCGGRGDADPRRDSLQSSLCRCPSGYC